MLISVLIGLVALTITVTTARRSYLRGTYREDGKNRSIRRFFVTALWVTIIYSLLGLLLYLTIIGNKILAYQVISLIFLGAVTGLLAATPWLIVWGLTVKEHRKGGHDAIQK